jgi:hypothetical protein
VAAVGTRTNDTVAVMGKFRTVAAVVAVFVDEVYVLCGDETVLLLT